MGRYDFDLTKLVGMTMKEVRQEGDEEIYFTADDGRMFKMYHIRDCCESVTIDDIAGDLQDLVNSPIVRAEVRESAENPVGVEKEFEYSFTWTFYEFATVKGSVTIRWYGASNGYYSERVDFVETTKEPSK